MTGDRDDEFDPERALRLWSAVTAGSRSTNAHRVVGLLDLFPELLRPVKRADLPCECWSPASCALSESTTRHSLGAWPLYDAIMHLNDEHGESAYGEWPRERVADWVDEVTR